MSRDWRLYFDDMVEACRRIGRYTSGFDQQAFVSESLVWDAVARNLEILGEAAKNIPPEIRAKLPSIDWRGITGFRVIVAHVYFGLDEDTVWDLVTNEVPLVLRALEAFLPERDRR